MIFEALTLIVLLAGFGLLYSLIKSRLHKQDMMFNHITEQHYLLSKQHSEFRDILENTGRMKPKVTLSLFRRLVRLSMKWCGSPMKCVVTC